MAHSKKYKENSMRLGCHVSAAGGVSKAFERAVDIGCGAFQFFSKNQAQWKGKELTEEEVELFKSEQKRTGIGPVTIHDSYLINLCAPKPEMLQKSLDAFDDEIKRADRLEVPYLNFHPGSHLGEGEEWGIDKIAESLNILIDRNPGSTTMLVLEATAGQGANIGYKFEHLRDIIDKVQAKERMGVCIDTAHIFAAGYDLRDEEVYENTFQEFDRVIGLDKLKLFHLNDSKKAFESRVDRHENIGEGHIGGRAFELIVNDPRHFGKPMILETPGGEEFFKKNLITLRKMIVK